MTGEPEGGRAAAGVPGGPFTSGGELEAARMRYARRLAGRGTRVSAADRLAELAARLLGTDSAQVSVVADVQTVVGGVGAAAASVGVESPAEESLCTVTVREGRPVAVTDAPHDPRVRDLPPVTSGVVGSYLGVPLAAGGHVVGALCVFDAGPRGWDEDDISLLELLATPVMAELELAALEVDYGDERLIWQLAVDAAGVGAFDWNLLTGELRWDQRLLDLFGLARDTFGGTIEAFVASLHPDDRDRVGAALTEAIAACGEYRAEYRVVLPGGSVRWVGARGQALAGPDGDAVRVLGAAYDVTAVRDVESRVARVLESMPTAFYQLDDAWRFTYVNGEARRLLSGVSSDPVGATIWDLFPATVGSEFETHYRAAVETGRPVTFEAHYPPPLDGWYEVRAWPDHDGGLAVYFIEITERHAIGEQRRLAAARAGLLAEVTAALTDTLDGEEAVGRLAQMLVPVLGDWCVVTLVDGADAAVDARLTTNWRRRLRDVGWWHADPDRRDLVERYTAVRIPALADTSFVAETLQRSKPVLIPAHAAEKVGEVLVPGEARDLARRLAPESAVVVPLRGRNRTAGLLTIFRDQGRPGFTPEDLDTLTQLAGRAGLALDNARLYTEQRNLAEGLQRSMLTAPPEPDHVHVAVRYAPAAEAAQIGGDWYDAFIQPEGGTVLVIGDVVGHDTEAAAAMGQVRGLLRGIAVTTGEGPADVLRRVDAAMQTLRIETTATAVVARLEQTPDEVERGVTRLRWSNAGHPPPVVVLPAAEGQRPGTLTLQAAGSNLLLGIDPGTRRDEHTVTLPRGSTVLLYSDGLVERRGEVIDRGVERLSGVVADLVADGLGLEAFCDEVLTRMVPDARDDDIALVAVRLHPQDRPRPAEAGPTAVPPGVPADPATPDG
ncbi:SpoIIE family protein phosphatase [Nocardioides sp. SOB77]|uniref:SpoIIE family protein phosphatase n=1 Tax=Nocardioides oceani TaxID=3058369 RepID=A0ABT8FG92_9ACTN|nr:SpoIIE family protein phosphatase [Nocardioides oceani]MDN4173432.1 SpoIIE family protein phosphatase [Nocardioides oceani]